MGTRVSVRLGPVSVSGNGAGCLPTVLLLAVVAGIVATVVGIIG